jgi:hypothetical protein
MNIYGSDSFTAQLKVVQEKDVFHGLEEAPMDFTWFRDGKAFTPEERFKVMFKDEEDTLALLFQHVTPEDAGLYTCIASTTSGRISCSAELTVKGRYRTNNGSMSFAHRQQRLRPLRLYLTGIEPQSTRNSRKHILFAQLSKNIRSKLYIILKRGVLGGLIVDIICMRRS